MVSNYLSRYSICWYSITPNYSLVYSLICIIIKIIVLYFIIIILVDETIASGHEGVSATRLSYNYVRTQLISDRFL